MAKLVDLVGHARCAECGFESAEVFKNKRGKLVLKCPKGEGCNCTYTNQSFEAQEILRRRTKMISEKPAPAAGSSEIKKELPTSESVNEDVLKASEGAKTKKTFSLFRKG